MELETAARQFVQSEGKQLMGMQDATLDQHGRLNCSIPSRNLPPQLRYSLYKKGVFGPGGGFFSFESRGKIPIEGRGTQETFFLERDAPETVFV